LTHFWILSSSYSIVSVTFVQFLSLRLNYRKNK
jgi:hypothetical protein